MFSISYEGKRKVGYLLQRGSQTHDQKRFTISEVAADLHELMIYTTVHYAATHCPP